MTTTTAVLRKGASIGILGPSAARLETLGIWFDAAYPDLVRFAYFVSGNRSLAEDLVQDSFIRVAGSRGNPDDPAFAGYVRRTIVNLSRSAHRRTTVERRVSTRALDRVDGPAAPDETWRAILTLSPQQRACVALRYYEDLSQQQIADLLGVGKGTVKKQLNRGVTRLRTIIEGKTS